MLKWMVVLVLAVFAGSTLFALSPTRAQDDSNGKRMSWGAIKALYRGADSLSASPSAPTMKARSATPMASSACSGWKFPFVGRWQISCFYGPYGGSSYHTGADYYALDWNLPGETDYDQYVVAPAGGSVLFAGSNGNGYGNQVLVDAGGGRIYRVAHLNSVSVSPNMSVGQGAILGRCGHTGSAVGSHVHFVVYVNATNAGNGRVVGNSIPQDGISGTGNLVRYQYYSSYQWMSGP